MNPRRPLREQISNVVRERPAGILPLAAAVLVLVLVPFARANGIPGTAAQQATGAAGPQQSAVRPKIAARPRIAARIVRARALGGRSVLLAGRVTHRGQGRSVVRFWVRPARSGRWKLAERVRAGRSGRFKISWNGSRPGRYMTRVSVRHAGKGDSDRVGRVYIFRRGHASWYGPGLYGGGLACGGRLTPNTLGVAHKTLPCGTRVTFTLGNGRVVTAPVVDRGPFIAGRDWDLTSALKTRLRFGSTGAVWATG